MCSVQLVRDRVIVDIEDLQQAAKIEETVNTGYCDTIKDNLVHWIAVEEDIIDSYARLSERIGGGGPAERVRNLVSSSTETLSTLRELLKSFESLGKQRLNRIREIKDLEKSASSALKEPR